MQSQVCTPIATTAFRTFLPPDKDASSAEPTIVADGFPQIRTDSALASSPW